MTQDVGGDGRWKWGEVEWGEVEWGEVEWGEATCPCVTPNVAP